MLDVTDMVGFRHSLSMGGRADPKSNIQYLAEQGADLTNCLRSK
jgi:hypothetical protein